MKYAQVITGIFLARPNRFVARVLIGGAEELCHVKNTGRCRELLVPGARVVLSLADNPARRTKYDLVAVWKGDILVNMDSQAPNIAFGEWAREMGFPGGLTELRPETVRGDSRFDFYYNSKNGEGFIEVKGVTLENGGVVSFPDAPTARGAKHLRGLTRCVEEGCGAYIAFVVQMSGAKYFTPNDATDPGFAAALRQAAAAGVKVMALECAVSPDEMRITGNIDVKL